MLRLWAHFRASGLGLFLGEQTGPRLARGFGLLFHLLPTHTTAQIELCWYLCGNYRLLSIVSLYRSETHRTSMLQEPT